MICSVLYIHKGRVKDVINGELELQDDISKLTDVLKKPSTQQYDIDQMFGLSGPRPPALISCPRPPVPGPPKILNQLNLLLLKVQSL